VTPFELTVEIHASAESGLYDAGDLIPARSCVLGWEPAVDCDGLYVWVAGFHVSDQPPAGWSIATPGMRCLGIPVLDVGVRYDACVEIPPDGSASSCDILLVEGMDFTDRAWAVYSRVLRDGLAGIWGDCEGFYLSPGTTTIGGGVASFGFTAAVQLSGGVDGS
jgi:hypothetical protein